MPALTVPPGVEGLASLTELPDETWRDRWDRIVLPDAQKDRLLDYVLFSLRHRSRVSPIGLPIHGLIVLSGPPGTGKTTLAAGVADQAARTLDDGPLLFVDIDPHVFPSQLLGESQRSVARLFERTLPDLASRGHPVVVLLDEVEALAVSRSRASLETNPVDVHRATDAVLSGVDRVARDWPNVTFVATTNYRAGVDAAFMSRADLVEEIDTPGPEAMRVILADTLGELSSEAANDGDALAALAAGCAQHGLDARQARKLVLRAACSRRELALHPDRIRVADVAEALRSWRPPGAARPPEIS
ncbi:MAG: AAA family ATPase [Chloroflexota bacterium]